MNISLSPLVFGADLATARSAVILLHGRGSSPEDMQDLASVFETDDVTFVAPAAPGGTWYPQRSFAPLAANEPWLSAALHTVDATAADLVARGMPATQIGLVGFSQGACLALEHTLRAPRTYAFTAALSGALIGPNDTPRPARDFQRQPILIGCAQADPHIPLEFVEKSAGVLELMNADVTAEIYPGGAHTVFPSEIAWINRQLQRREAPSRR